jgi:outer membrane lipoprotein SlyB
MKKFFLLLLIPILLIGCDYATQTRYGYSEVGQVQVVQFGTVIAIRDIEIMGESSVGGAIAGGAAGAAAGGNIGGGTGTAVAVVAGAVVGATAGAALERAIRKRGGVEYTVVLENGKTITVAQNVSEKDVIHKNNDRVIVQINGQYQRVLPANSLSEEMKKPKGIKFTDEKK